MAFLSSIRRAEERRLAARKAEALDYVLSGDAIREHTRKEILERIDTRTRANIRFFADKGPEELGKRIHDLDEEWTLDRALMVVTAGASLIGLAGFRFSGPRWVLLPALAAGFLLEHAFKGWFLSASVFRKLGFRTDSEVQFEKNALRLLRGDFTIISEGDVAAERSKLTAELLRASP